MNVCVIGDCHVAPLIAAWQNMAPDYPNVTVSFNGAPSRILVRWLDAFTIEAWYSHYLIVGLSFDPGFVPRLQSERQETGRYPDPKFVHAIVLGLVGTPAVATVRRIHDVTDAPVTILPTPHQTRNHGNSAYRYACLFHEAAQSVADDVGATYHPQPERTLYDPFSTDRRFAEGPAHFDGIGGTDGAHMNADYGEAVLFNILASILEGQKPDDLNIRRPTTFCRR